MARNQAGVVDVATPVRGQAARIAGLGDVVSRVAAAAGLQPCAACHERAARLNEALPFERR